MGQMVRRTLVAVLAGALLHGSMAGAAVAGTASAGDPDTTFGTGGRSEAAEHWTRGIVGKAVVVQPDGRIVAAGTTYGSGNYLLARYERDGTIDRSYGTNGLASTLGQQNSYRPPVIASQMDGGVPKMLAHWEGDILRFDENGKLDLSFGNEGHAWTPNLYPAWARDIETSSTGDRIITLADPGKFGVSATGGYQAQPQALIAFTQDGQPDETFGTGGMVLLGEPFLGDTVALKDAVIQPDGKIVVTGGWLTVRLLPNGSRDESFGDHGIVVDTDTDRGFNQRVEIDREGRIVVMRCLHNNSTVWGEVNWGCELVRYLPDGSIDGSYGAGGRALVSEDLAMNFEIDSKGRSVVFGETEDGSKDTVTRLLPDGSLDMSFGEGGTAFTSNNFDGMPGAGAIQSDDKPLRVASVSDYVEYETDMHVWRYLAEAGQSAEDPQVTTPILTGTIRDAKTSAPIAGALVDCGDGRSARSASDGSYSLELPQGSYTCTATADSYRGAKVRIHMDADGLVQDFLLRR